MGSFEEKACKFLVSLILLAFFASILPMLWNHIGVNAILGYVLGVVYVKDRYG